MLQIRSGDALSPLPSSATSAGSFTIGSVLFSRRGEFNLWCVHQRIDRSSYCFNRLTEIRHNLPVDRALSL